MPSNSNPQLKVDLIPGNVSSFRKSIEASLKDVKVRIAKSSFKEMRSDIVTKVNPKVKLGVNSKFLASEVNKVLKNKFEIGIKLGSTKVVVDQLQKRLNNITVNPKKSGFKDLHKEISNLNKSLGSLKFNKGNGQQYRKEAKAFFSANPIMIKTQLVLPNNTVASNIKKSVNQGIVSTASNKPVSSVSGGLDKTNKQLQVHNKLVKQASAHQFEFGERLGFTSARLLAYLVPASAFFQIARAARFASSAIIDINRDINRLTQVFNGNASKARSVSRDILEISRQYGQSGRELLNVSVLLAQSGEKFSDNNAILDVVEGLAQTQLAATFGDISNVLEGTIATLNQFSLAGTDAVRVLDSANILSKNFAFEAENLFTAVKSGGAAFSVAGGGFEEFAATVAAVRDITRLSAATVGTSLNTISLRLIRPDVVEFLETFKGGFDVRDDQGQLKSVTDILRNVGSRFNEFNKDEIGEIVQNLSGVRQGKALIPLLEDIAKGGDNSRFLKAIELQKSAPGSLARDAFIGQDRIDVQLGKISARFEQVFGSLANDENIKQLVKDVASLADSLGDVLEVSAPLLPLLIKLGAIKLAFGVARGIPGFIGGTRNNNPGPFKHGGADGISILGAGGSRNPLLHTRNASLSSGQSISDTATDPSFFSRQERSGIRGRFDSRINAKKVALSHFQRQRARLNVQRAGISTSLSQVPLLDRNQFNSQKASLAAEFAAKRQLQKNIIRGAQTNIAFASGRGNIAAADRPGEIARNKSIIASSSKILQQLSVRRKELSSLASLDIQNSKKRIAIESQLRQVEQQLIAARKNEVAASKSLGFRGTLRSGVQSIASSRFSSSIKSGAGIAASIGIPLAIASALTASANSKKQSSLIDPQTGQLVSNAGEISRSNALVAASKARSQSAATGAFIGGVAGSFASPVLGTAVGAGAGAFIGDQVGRIRQNSIIAENEIDSAFIISSFEEDNKKIVDSFFNNISDSAREQLEFDNSVARSVPRTLDALFAQGGIIESSFLNKIPQVSGYLSLLDSISDRPSVDDVNQRVENDFREQLKQSNGFRAFSERARANVRNELSSDPSLSFDDAIQNLRDEFNAQNAIKNFTDEEIVARKLLIETLVAQRSNFENFQQDVDHLRSALDITTSSFRSLSQDIQDTVRSNSIQSALSSNRQIINSASSSFISGNSNFDPFSSQISKNRSLLISEQLRSESLAGSDTSGIVSSLNLSSSNKSLLQDLSTLSSVAGSVSRDFQIKTSRINPSNLAEGQGQALVTSFIEDLTNALPQERFNTSEGQAERERFLSFLRQSLTTSVQNNPSSIIGTGLEESIVKAIRSTGIDQLITSSINSEDEKRSSEFQRRLSRQDAILNSNNSITQELGSLVGIRSRINAFNLSSGSINGLESAGNFRSLADEITPRFGLGQSARNIAQSRLSAQQSLRNFEADPSESNSLALSNSIISLNGFTNDFNNALQKSSLRLNLLTQEYQQLQNRVNGIIGSLQTQGGTDLGTRLNNSLFQGQASRQFAEFFQNISSNNISSPTELLQQLVDNPDSNLLTNNLTNIPQSIFEQLVSSIQARGDLGFGQTGLTGNEAANLLRTARGAGIELQDSGNLQSFAPLLERLNTSQDDVHSVLERQLEAQRELNSSVKEISEFINRVPNNGPRNRQQDGVVENVNNNQEGVNNPNEGTRTILDSIEKARQELSEIPREQRIFVEGDTRVDVSGFDNIGRGVASSFIFMRMFESLRDKLNISVPEEANIRNAIDGAIREFKNAANITFQ